jgi:hypothetical protein
MNKRAKYIAVITTTNYWHNKSGSVDVFGVATDLKSGMKACDKDHDHAEKWCDYCGAKWKIEKNYAIKRVDHDGAFVEYEVWLEPLIEPPGEEKKCVIEEDNKTMVKSSNRRIPDKYNRA